MSWRKSSFIQHFSQITSRMDYSYQNCAGVFRWTTVNLPPSSIPTKSHHKSINPRRGLLIYLDELEKIFLHSTFLLNHVRNQSFKGELCCSMSMSWKKSSFIQHSYYVTSQINHSKKSFVQLGSVYGKEGL